MKRFYRLDRQYDTLNVYKQRDGDVSQVIELAGKVKYVDDKLQRQLREGYERELKDSIELPKTYDKPFAVVYGQQSS